MNLNKNDVEALSTGSLFKEITAGEYNNATASSEGEEEDNVFPLPGIAASSSTSSRKRHGMNRNATTSLSVKDLSKSFDQMVSKQQEQCQKPTSNKEVVGGWRWRGNGNASIAGNETTALYARAARKSSTIKDDFFTYRPLGERGKRWVLAGIFC